MGTPDLERPPSFALLAGGVYVVHLGAGEQFYRPNPHCKSQLTAVVECFEYSGDAAGLIAVGVASEQMLGRRRPGSARFDEEGYRCQVVRSWREGKDGKPYQHYHVVRARPLNRIGEFPGTREAIQAMQSYQGFCEARLVAARAEMDARRHRPQLRLVVDNTREASHD
jgi:hypothetical protein